MKKMDITSLPQTIPIEKIKKAILNGKPEYISGGLSKPGDIFSLDEFWKIVPDIKLNTKFPLAFQGLEQAPLAFETAAIRKAIHSGKSICVSRIDQVHKQLGQLCRLLEVAIGLPGLANCHVYYSPPGTGYSFFHVDAGVAVTLQIEGEKKWRYSQGVSIPWPLSAGGYRKDNFEWLGRSPWQPEEKEFSTPKNQVIIEQKLAPGDILIIPSGVWHSACAEQSTSLSVNLRLTPFPALEGILNSITEECVKNVHFRAPVPFVNLEEIHEDKLKIEQLEYCRTLIDEMQIVLEKIKEDDTSVERIWRSNFPWMPDNEQK